MNAPALIDVELVGVYAQQRGASSADNPFISPDKRAAWQRGFIRAWCNSLWKVM